jgi:benzoyl-CoA reductase/2-hydroxyglutaryl-CoA dehydratase subunit BcrC/BadD/HgdB
VVHFSSAACRHANASFRLIKDALAKRDIPFLVLDGDMSDERSYSAERTRSSLESFIELMAAKK